MCHWREQVEYMTYLTELNLSNNNLREVSPTNCAIERTAHKGCDFGCAGWDVRVRRVACSQPRLRVRRHAG